ncbi:unnamed protein product [Acanthoscelides obtectus]|uniref:Uncharacterized protein n=1 Tax=Acanthoscelides obtectus TaxID=200917 RepID=A0A9P0K082_ACAOB|nr:unnamed protein product [Acanthoscelides obtectus]CAK1625210.1 hypothetical protein AOBTE_LOCUS3035 [Acanthoscelides obtectus]
MGCEQDRCKNRNQHDCVKRPPSFYQRNKMSIRMAALGAATLAGGFLFYKHYLHGMVHGNEDCCECECGSKKTA